MRKKLFATLSMATLLLLSFGGCGVQKPDEAELTILYTTDLHGAILAYDFNKDQEAIVSLANVSAYVKEVRDQNKDGVILLDAGDFLQGQPSIYYSNFVDTTEIHIQARVMDYLGYDALAVGNHDIEPGAEVYDRLKKEFRMPWLAANAVDVRTGKPYFQPYAIIERKGLKIAVLGMITPNIEAWLPKYLWENIDFIDMVETAQKWVPYIMENEKPDLLIGLFHSGGGYESETTNIDTYKHENGGVPAAIKVDGFDLILLGHDHQERSFEIENSFGNKVSVLDAVTGARFVGRADIKLTKSGSSYAKEVKMELIPMRDVQKDSAFEKAFAADVELINNYVDAEIGTLTDTLYSIDGLFGPSAFMDLIHNAQLDATGADISFAGILSTDAIIPPGKLTMRNLFTLYKYENLLYTMELKGSDIKQFLEFGFDRQFNQMRSVNDHLLAFKIDDKGNPIRNIRHGLDFLTPSFNFTSAAGIKHTVDVTKPKGERVTILSMSDGTPFDLDKKYKVAVNSYQASGGGGFFTEGLGWTKEHTDAHIVNASKNDVRKYIADYIISKKVIDPVVRGDWSVIPDSYFKAGRAKDMRLMKK